MSKLPRFGPAGPFVSLRLSIPSLVSAIGACLHPETDKSRAKKCTSDAKGIASMFSYEGVERARLKLELAAANSRLVSR
jgi:hypothetical protein